MPKKIAQKRPVNKQTPSITEEQLDGLRDSCRRSQWGRIDIDKLRASLGDFADERPERYSFTWAGKRDSIRILQTPSGATLVPVHKESVDFKNTQNIFIEGENLETLKLLYKAYFGHVKMIYIDPPYNTGNDFVYPDNFADPLDTYLKLTGQKDSEGNLLTSNAETNGRYHSAWLSMLYPRLFLAKQLLNEDGVIFISIDDHEIYSLRLLLNEIFGEKVTYQLLFGEGELGQVWRRLGCRQTMSMLLHIRKILRLFMFVAMNAIWRNIAFLTVKADIMLVCLLRLEWQKLCVLINGMN